MTLGHGGESVADRYRLDRLAGGTPDLELWEAYDTRLARSVSVRLERDPEVADGDGGAEQSEDPRSVLSRIAGLNHPHVAAVYDVGVVDGAERVRYAVSEWSAGHTLGQLMQSGPLPWTRVADWGWQASAGLAALHEIGIVHGALDPDRVAVFDDRRIKIVDAGLEQSLGGDAAADEQGAADDVHALGEMLWRAVAGAPPAARIADRDAEPESGGRVLDTEPLREAGMPPVLIDLLTEMLDDDPAARPTAAGAQERFAPLVPVERVADTVPEYPPSPALGAATARTQAIRPAAPPAGEKKRRGLMIGLALLIAAAGAGLGLVIANLSGSSAANPPPVNISVSGSTGVINLPNPTVTTPSAAPHTSAPPTTPAASSAPPASPSASPSATPSAGASASTSASAGASASSVTTPGGGSGQSPGGGATSPGGQATGGSG